MAEKAVKTNARVPLAAREASPGAAAVRALSDGLSAVSDMVGQFIKKAPAGAPAAAVGVSPAEFKVLPQKSFR